MSSTTAGQGRSTGGYSVTPSMSTYVGGVTVLYLGIGFGTILTLFLFSSLAGSMGPPSLGGGFGAGSSLQSMISLAFALLLLLGPLITGVVAFVTGRAHDDGGAGAVTGAVSNAVGLVVTVLLLFVFLIVQAGGGPGVGDALGRLVVGLIGVGLGIAVTGAIGGAAGAHTAGP